MFLKWTIKRFAVLVVVVFALIQIAINVTGYLGLNRVLEDNQRALNETNVAHGITNKLGQKTTKLAENYLPLLEAAQALHLAIDETKQEILRAVLEGAENAERLNKAHGSLKSAFSEVERLWLDGLPVNILKRMEAKILVMDDTVAKVLEMSNHRKSAELEKDAGTTSSSVKNAATELRTAIYAVVYKAADDINQHSHQVKRSVDAGKVAAESSTAKVQSMIANNMAFIALVVLALVLVAVLMFMMIIHPMKSIVGAVANLSEGEGDLTQRLEVSGRDELSQLADAFNQFIARIDDMVSQMTHAIVRLIPMTQELSSTNANILQSTDAQKRQTEVVTVHMHETMKSAEEVADSVDEISTIATNSVTKLNEGQRVARITIDAMDQLAKEITTANDAVSMLKTDSEKVESVIDVIDSISEQTNLLALNAAIEAARAGEAGRGFAVVADEVRNLASRTRESTLEVQAMIHSIQGNTHRVTSAMDQGVTSTNNSIDLVNKTAGAIGEVGQLINEINNRAGEIKAATQRQNENFRSVSESISIIEGFGQQSILELDDNFEFGRDLHKLKDKLQTMVGAFKVTNSNWNEKPRVKKRITDDAGKNQEPEIW